MVTPTTDLQALLDELARAKAIFQQRAIAAHLGKDMPLPTPPEEGE